MKKLLKLGCFISLFAVLFEISPSVNKTGTIFSALAAEVEWSGDLEITGNLSLPTAGKALVFPDGTRQTSAPPQYARTIIVRPVGNSVQNGTELLAKRAAITDASSSKPYLLKIEPGVYDIGTDSLVMSQYIDLEGSGPSATTISGGGEGMLGTVIGASNAEIRNLSVTSLGTGSWSRAIYNSHSLRITNIEASARGATSNAAIVNTSGSTPFISHVTAWAEGGTSSYGIYNYSCSASLHYVKANAMNSTGQNYGIYNEEMTYIMNVTATASGSHNNYGVWNTNGSSTILRHITADITGGTDCYGIFNDHSDCDMISLTASASGGGSLNAGVFNSYSSVSMVNITADSSGGVNNNYGVCNSHSLSIVMNNVRATASGGAKAYGVYNNMSEPSLTNVYAEGSGGTTKSCGMINFPDSGTSSYILAVDRSTFKGTDESISSNEKYTLNIGLSKLDGSASAAGTWHCFGCFSGSYAALGGDCQPMP